jgi:hypothetical protein
MAPGDTTVDTGGEFVLPTGERENSFARDPSLPSLRPVGGQREFATSVTVGSTPKKELARVELRASRADPNSILGKTYAGQAEELQARIKALEGDAGARRLAELAELVKQAVEGHEDARKGVELTAAAVPLAFPPGFVEAISSAEFDRAALTELVVALK